jgi:hypothetical protein
VTSSPHVVGRVAASSRSTTSVAVPALFNEMVDIGDDMTYRVFNSSIE